MTGLLTALLLISGATRVDQLFAAEGETLRELVRTADAERKGELLLRLGDWAREAAFRVERAGGDAGPSAAHLLEAERALSAAVLLVAPDRLPDALFALGDLRRTRGDVKGAAEVLGRLVAERPEHPLAVDAALALGDDAFDAGRLAAALSHFEFASASAREPGARAYADYKRAWCELNLEDFAGSRALLESVIALADESGLSLVNEARRDLVRVLARDLSVGADEAREVIVRLVPADRARRYQESYARLVTAAGRDDPARAVLDAIADGAPVDEAIRIFTLGLEIAVRHRDLPRVTDLGTRLGAALAAHPALAKGEDAEVAERALRVGAVTLHGEGRANGATPVLEAALALYEAWFPAFDAREAAYELHHHAGELLLGLGRHAESERHSTAAVRRDLAARAERGRTGRWLESSAENALLAAERAIPPVTPGAPLPDAPAPIEPAEVVFLDASDRYLELLPEGAQAVSVAYRRALVLYRRGHLESARHALESLALAHPTSEVATHAGELALDALKRTGRFDELAALASRLLSMPAHAAKAGAELGRVREQAILAAAAREAGEGDPGEAAARYRAYVREYPRGAGLDRALFNEAAALAAAGREDESVRVRAELLARAGSSPLAAQAREVQLAALVRLGRFRDALPLATRVAEGVKGTSGAGKLHDAIVLAEAAGDRGAAEALRARYVKLFPRGAEAMAHALELADGRRGCDARKTALEKALALAPDVGWRVVVLSRLARAAERCGDEPLARWFAGRATALAAKVTPARADALDAAADAALLLTRPKVDRYRRERLGEPWERTLLRKMARLAEADEAFASVVARGRAAPAVCALVASGLGYADLARALSKARAPRAFTGDQRALFEEQLAAQAQPLVDRAKAALTGALARATEAGVAPECLADARRELADLWPDRFGARAEILLPLTPAAEPVEDARALLARHPDAPAAWLLAAREELAARRPHAALVLLARVPDGDVLEPEALATKARALEAAGKVEAALAAWRRLAALPGGTLARRVLADRALLSGDLDGARRLLETLANEESDAVDVRVDLGVVLRALGEAEAAERASREALQLAPGRGEPALNLGLLLCAEGARPKEGLALLEVVVSQGTRPPERGAFEAAIAACRALAKGKP